MPFVCCVLFVRIWTCRQLKIEWPPNVRWCWNNIIDAKHLDIFIWFRPIWFYFQILLFRSVREGFFVGDVFCGLPPFPGQIIYFYRLLLFLNPFRRKWWGLWTPEPQRQQWNGLLEHLCHLRGRRFFLSLSLSLAFSGKFEINKGKGGRWTFFRQQQRQIVLRRGRQVLAQSFDYWQRCLAATRQTWKNIFLERIKFNFKGWEDDSLKKNWRGQTSWESWVS